MLSLAHGKHGTGTPVWRAAFFCRTAPLRAENRRAMGWGKGAYCGWLCTCGALAETLGDQHRRKMLHGPGWNRLNMLGQVVLAFAFALLGLRIAGWTMGPQSWPSQAFNKGFASIPYLNFQWSVDLFLAAYSGLGCISGSVGGCGAGSRARWRR